MVLPSFSSFGWGCFIPRLLLGGVAWSPPSLALFSSPFTWCCLVSSLFGWCLLFGGADFLLLHWVVVRFPSLLLRGAAWFLPSLGGVAVLLPFLVGCSFITSLFVPSLSGVAFPLLLRGAAWSPPPFGGVAVFPFPVWWSCLPSPPLGSGAFPLSSVGWCCLVSSFLLVVLLFFLLLGGAAFITSSFVPSLSGVAFPLLLRGAAWFLPSLGALSCLVVLPSSPPVGGAAFSHVFCWVVLLGLLLLLVVLFFLLLFGGAAFLLLLWPPLLLFGAVWFHPSFWVVLLFFLLLLVGCSFITSSFVPSLSGVAFPLLLRGAAWFLPSLGGLSCLVVLPSISSIG